MENAKELKVRELVQTLQQLPQDMCLRVMVESKYTAETSYYKIQDVEVHDLDDTVPDRPWNEKVVVLKIIQ